MSKLITATDAPPLPNPLTASHLTERKGLIDHQILRVRNYLVKIFNTNLTNATKLSTQQVASENTAIVAALSEIWAVEVLIRPIVQPYLDQQKAEEVRLKAARQH